MVGLLWLLWLWLLWLLYVVNGWRPIFYVGVDRKKSKSVYGVACVLSYIFATNKI